MKQALGSNSGQRYPPPQGGLARRQPRVSGDHTVAGPDRVKQNRDAVKAAEREAKDGRWAPLARRAPCAPAAPLAATVRES